jgi:hypothetical protein
VRAAHRGLDLVPDSEPDVVGAPLGRAEWPVVSESPQAAVWVISGIGTLTGSYSGADGTVK